ncbi:hypothetical protein GGI25_004634 [Coemansia spiralis]|uniref:Bromo domain-containing protein n=2 Tax=Coemansia TaxID=4863 RepID=A0A9W8G693_9FUNG|nr:hypothetical protein EDC05_004558 [Coemansia umbellata]KAJ2620419.1 hypothetical protein GGI26_004989 [Coemansia sp. RSA 1358]KAJ2673649.1 hypothetical protein GGI25_004634 [Coemansia spiralis]
MTLGASISSDSTGKCTTHDMLIVLSVASTLGTNNWEKIASIVSNDPLAMPGKKNNGTYTSQECKRLFTDALQEFSEPGSSGKPEEVILNEAILRLKVKRLDEIKARLEIIDSELKRADVEPASFTNNNTNIADKATTSNISTSTVGHTLDDLSVLNMLKESGNGAVTTEDENDKPRDAQPSMQADMLVVEEYSTPSEQQPGEAIARSPSPFTDNTWDSLEEDKHKILGPAYNTLLASEKIKTVGRSKAAADTIQDSAAMVENGDSESRKLGEESGMNQIDKSVNIATEDIQCKNSLKPGIEITEKISQASSITNESFQQTPEKEKDNIRIKAKYVAVDSEPRPVHTPPSAAFTTAEGKAATLAIDEQQLKNWKKNITTVWRDISGHRFGSMFISPIKSADAPNYYDVIRKPMDLKTIKNRIRDEEITTTVEFYRDIMQMLMNALMYNAEDTEVYQMTMEFIPDAQACIEQLLQTEEAVKQPKGSSSSDGVNIIAVTGASGGSDSVLGADVVGTQVAVGASKHEDETRSIGENHDEEDSDASSVPAKRKRRMASERASKHLRV